MNIGKQMKKIVKFLLQLQLGSILSGKMGSVNGKPVLSEEDLDFIANHTTISRDQVDKVKIFRDKDFLHFRNYK